MPLCIQTRASGRPRAASVWAISFSWCGKTRSDPAAVDLEVDAEDLLGHRRALDVPARPPLAPGRRPARVLALLARLPEREVLRRLLELGGVVALALLHLLERAVRELAVAVEARHAEVDVAAGRVGVAASRPAPRSARRSAPIVSVACGSASGRPSPSRVGVRDVARRSSRAASSALGHASLAGGVVDLVVDVGDVRDEASPRSPRARGSASAGRRPRTGARCRRARGRRRSARRRRSPPARARAARARDLARQGVVDADLAHGRKATRPADGGSAQPSSASSWAASAEQDGVVARAADELHADRHAVVADPAGTASAGCPVRFHCAVKG